MIKKWNSENIIFKNSDEYKHLTEISDLISLSNEVVKKLSSVYDNQYYNIKRNEDKSIRDFSGIKNKLLELIESL